ncbi:hypothetical protein BCV72DRAFT_201058 [Rhizopus microsporus var. microsporus]|uniref:Transcription factor CBF/NF-Y/archaeal histone domain-containing protein n=1 Tax=Rhizopus microsporus var. microsporus TaxID=86635 RepID=A0A1X0RCD4_RHIZD|nr:hypothetical protein BCV72DRAFT_201058 [Rhizopus microsporus var. microsporus]
MQLDEDVGKVAQATPILISCQESRSRQAKRLTVAHLKKAIENVEQFDFLKDIVANIPDPLEPSEENGGQKTRSSRKSAARNVKEE